MLALTDEQKILKPQAIYGYWKCAGQGNDLILFEQDGITEAARFTLPRQPKEDGDCIADFVRDVDDAQRDVIGLQVVTMGQKASDIAREWFEENRYQDYLYLHGLSVEMAEALAEYVHKRIRAELGYAGEDAQDIEKMLSQGYRGGRYSFGYPACPRLEDQGPLLKLLGAERIGVDLSDDIQLHPEQSTSAIVLHHPRAKYFTFDAPHENAASFHGGPVHHPTKTLHIFAGAPDGRFILSGCAALARQSRGVVRGALRRGRCGRNTPSCDGGPMRAETGMRDAGWPANPQLPPQL
jgi:hypothetical protein